MRIDPDKLSRIQRKTVAPAESSAASPAEITAASGPATAGQVDQVVLSQRAVEIQRAKEALARVPEVRQNKVAALRKRIQEGNYQIDAAAIADKILSGGP